MKTITGKIEAIEALRREKTDVRLRTVTVDGIDYAGSGLLVQHALAALDEGIPNRQRMRVQTALMALVEGTSDMVRWAHANGYFSDAALRAAHEQASRDRDQAWKSLHETLETRDHLFDMVKDMKGKIREVLAGSLSDQQRDLLEAAWASQLPTPPEAPSPAAPEPPKGHIFAFMFQPRAAQFVELLQREGVGSTLTYDSDNNQHHVAVASANNDKALEVYELLKKEMSSGA